MPEGHLIQYHCVFRHIYKYSLSLEKGGPSIAFKMTQRRFSVGRASRRAGEVGGKRYTTQISEKNKGNKITVMNIIIDLSLSQSLCLLLTSDLNLFPLKSPISSSCTALPFCVFTHWLNKPYSLGTWIETKIFVERPCLEKKFFLFSTPIASFLSVNFNWPPQHHFFFFFKPITLQDSYFLKVPVDS